MTERRAWLFGLVVLAILVGLVVVSAAPRGEASSRSVSATGYRAVAAYLAAGGREVVDWDLPLAQLGEGGLLVVATPLAAAWTEEDEAAVRLRVDRGEAVLLLVGGADDPVTDAVLDAFGLATSANPYAAPPSWWPWAWGDGGRELTRPTGEVLRVKRTRGRVVGPRSAEALWTDPAGGAEGFVVRRPGPVAVFPGSAFANGWIDDADNLLALEELLARLAPEGPVVFDEWHQGLQRAEAREANPVRHVVIAVFLQGLFLYVLALWALSRRSGPRRAPPLPPPPVVVGELAALAQLHRRAGHAGEAGRWLLDAGRRLTRGGEALPERFEGGERGLVELGRKIAALQRRWAS